MKHGSKILFIFLGLLIFLSVSATFYKMVILQDFEIVIIDDENQVSESDTEGSDEISETAQEDMSGADNGE
jgi:hypothetical protein